MDDSKFEELMKVLLQKEEVDKIKMYIQVKTLLKTPITFQEALSEIIDMGLKSHFSLMEIAAKQSKHTKIFKEIGNKL